MPKELLKMFGHGDGSSGSKVHVSIFPSLYPLLSGPGFSNYAVSPVDPDAGSLPSLILCLLFLVLDPHWTMELRMSGMVFTVRE